MRPTRGPGGVTRPAQSAGRCWEALLKGRDWRLRVLEESREGSVALMESQESSRELEEVGSPFRRGGRGREALPKSQEWSRGPPGELRGVKRAGRGW